MTYRIAVAGAPTTRQLAETLASWGLDGTVLPAWGFTSKWGVETSNLIILAGLSRVKVHRLAERLAKHYGEEAVYVDTSDGDAWLVGSDASLENLTGETANL